MLRDWKLETEKRVEFIRQVLDESGAKGIVFGNSGGKDSALVGILCRKACDNTLGIMMPCGSKVNFTTDKEHALLVAEKFDIKTEEIDLSGIKELFSEKLKEVFDNISSIALANINPRLRMITLYAVAQSKGYLVAGTSNKSEITMGYFTKWGDGACDFNPIADLTVTEVYEYLRFLDVPHVIIDKPPSAGLWEGQTDEDEMGITYKEIDSYLLNRKASPQAVEKIQAVFNRTQHKREMPKKYSG